MIGPHPPVHPGEILREEFMVPPGLSGYGLAAACRVPRTRIERLAREETQVTAEMNLQTAFDLASADREAVEEIEPRAA